ncbi:MAG: MBL fold metallo-hydrolase RNA specificity domain-containing protein [Candidatus Woesearchaeota archaeon]
MIKITAIGGYGEIGRNMTLLTVGNESLILDMGIHMENLVSYEEQVKRPTFSVKELRKYDVLPNDTFIQKNTVQAIIPSHGHLDHIAAIPYLAKSYKCPIYCTPYTGEIILKQFSDSKSKKANDVIMLKPKTRQKIGTEFEIELFPITHSIPDAALILIHTRFGTVCYANDFKLDMSPTYAKKPQLDLLQKRAGNVKLLISECLRAKNPGHTSSESEAKKLLEELLYSPIIEDKAVFLTTFSSHIERLQTVVSMAKKIKRKVLVLGRSLDKYLYTAKRAGITDIIDHIEVVPFRRQVKRRLRQLQKEDTSKYIILMTGHQGEENAVLNSMLNGNLPDVFSKEDVFIFSCNTIPTQSIILAREKIEQKLLHKKITVFKDLHVSGHASKEDLRMMLQLLKPEYVIPSHGTKDMMDAYTKMAIETHFPKENIVYLFSGETKHFS